MMKSDVEITGELKRLTEGLLFISESDYPFEIVDWKGLPEINPQFLRGLTGQSEETPVEITDVDDFFRIATSEETWRSDESRTQAKRYRALAQSLKDNLDELRVYRVGEIKISVYIVGRNSTGNWLGISTQVVET